MQNTPKNICWRLSRTLLRTVRGTWRLLRLVIRQYILITPTKRIGRWGEHAARRYLKNVGLSIIQSNWRAGSCEADIIAHDRRTLILVEVKTRHASLMQNFPGRGAVTRSKRRTLHWLARSFVRSRGPLCRRLGLRSYRVDLVEIYYAPTAFGMLRVSSVRWHRGVSESNRGP